MVLQECKEAYRKHFPVLVRVFNHYCCTFTEGEDSVYQLKANAWVLMVKELRLASQESKHCQATNCQNAFVGASHDLSSASALSFANGVLTSVAMSHTLSKTEYTVPLYVECTTKPNNGGTDTTIMVTTATLNSRSVFKNSSNSIVWGISGQNAQRITRMDEGRHVRGCGGHRTTPKASGRGV
jgi:hypothetical protein